MEQEIKHCPGCQAAYWRTERGRCAACGALRLGSWVKERYCVRDFLGEGGTARVYRVWDQHTGEDRALKQMSPKSRWETSAWQKHVERLKREVHYASQINSPHILSALEFFVSGDDAYAVTPFIRGRTLEECIHIGPLEPNDMCSVATQVALALRTLHSYALVHRDVKPSNVMCAQDGHSILIDLGVAYHPEAPALTAPGAVLGTPHYMSPEQIQGQQVSSAADIYSFGIMLYELCFQQKPFRGELSMVLCAQIMEQMPHLPAQPPQGISTSVWTQIDQIIQTCTQKNPKDRFPTANVLCQQLLETWAQHKREKPPPLTPPPFHHRPMATVL